MTFEDILDQADASTHLNEAYVRFHTLQVPKYVERTAQLAREYGVTLVDTSPEGDA